MSGTTANGWPYVTPDDHPKEYPAASQALAQKLDAQPQADWGMLFITNGTGNIVFTKTFRANPVVVAVPAGPANRFASIGNGTTLGAQVWLTEKDGVTPVPAGDVFWIAVGL